MTSHSVDQADIVVVGGGPAGLATAIRVRQLGLSAMVVDRAEPPIDKPCGEGLMPDGLERLRQLGVRLPKQHTGPLVGIRYVDAELSTEQSTGPRVEARFPGGGGLGIRRHALHTALIECAETAGVDLRWETRVTGLLAGSLDRRSAAGVTIEGGAIRGHFVVGADGLHSKVRRWAGLEGPAVRHRRFGVRRHYRLAPWTDHVEVHWAEGCEAYVTPVGEREIGVAMLWSGVKGGFDAHLRRFPWLEERLAECRPTSHDRGCGPLHHRVSDVLHGRLALVGDAAGYLDAITGEGLSVAFHQAFALADAISRRRLSSYRRAYRRIVRLPNGLTRGLLFVERRPRLRRRLIRGLAADPRLFERLLGVHARTMTPGQLGVGPTLRLVRALATGGSRAEVTV